MSILFILDDPPYGTERSYNTPRLAISVAKRDGVPEAGICRTCMDARAVAEDVLVDPGPSDRRART